MDKDFIQSQPENDTENVQPDNIPAPEEEDGAEHLVLRVSTSVKERRLDKYLQARFGQFSRTTIQKLIKEHAITVNEKPVKPSCKLSPNDRLDLILPPPPVKEIQPEDIPLKIIYEDDEMIVINKQADLLVHPARGNRHGTLINALVFYSDKLSTVGGEFRPGIVHRLDRNTTGVIIIAKTDTAHWRIAKQFESRQTQKTYLAIVHGTPELSADCINRPLGINPKARQKFTIRHDIGKEAITFYEVLEAFRGFSLLKVTPKTGRTHQIRVHLTYLKHPIVGDDLYGGKTLYNWQVEDRAPQPEEPLMARCALHAWKIKIKHPTTNELMEFEAPLAEDMQTLLDKLRQFRKI